MTFRWWRRGPLGGRGVAAPIAIGGWRASGPSCPFSSGVGCEEWSIGCLPMRCMDRPTPEFSCKGAIMARAARFRNALVSCNDSLDRVGLRKVLLHKPRYPRVHVLHVVGAEGAPVTVSGTITEIGNGSDALLHEL